MSHGGESIVKIHEFCPEKIPQSCTFLIFGPPGSGKSTFMKNMMFYNRHRYPVGRAWCGSETFYKEMQNIMHPLYVTNDFNEEEIKTHIVRQKSLSMQTNTSDRNNSAILVIDDCCNDRRDFKTPLMRGIFKNGSQHYNQLCMVGTQFPVDIPKEIRSAASYVVVFKYPNPDDLQTVYRNFGGMAGSFQEFKQLMEQVTGDYTCLIFNNRLALQTSDKSKLISYYKTQVMPNNFTIGCREYREHAKARYNKRYQDIIDI